ncbi:MAG: glycosyl hydrolase family 53 [Firmicutes bacterium]|jgi:hypothetical protein|nr:glycosyl hydrolase family 53 [Bacillota bacterium]
MMLKGMTFGWGARHGDYRNPATEASLKALRDTGAEWIALSFWTWQEHVFSTEIGFDYGYTVTDHDLEHVIQLARNLGLKVLLKPVVNSKDGFWRGLIQFPDEEGARTDYWQAWFRSYRNFMNHYAELSHDFALDMFCIGCEMVKTEHREREWREVIADVRERYNGPIVYNANHGTEEQVTWFSELDLIGTSAYYPVASRPGATWQEMAERWQTVKPRLERLAERFQKPLVFMEIGCRSARGAAQMPWDFSHQEWPVSHDEQAAFYHSALETFWNEPWFEGFFWWDWRTHLYPLGQAAEDTGFDIYGKPAEQILRQYYQSQP